MQATAHRKTSRLGLTKQGSHLVDFRTFGNLNSTNLRPKSVSTTVTLNLYYCMVRSVGELLRMTWTNSVPFITAAYGRSAISIGQIKLPTTTCTRKLDVRALMLRLKEAPAQMVRPCPGIPKVGSRWTPPGKRKRGRPKTTWRRTVEMELKELGLTWGQAQALAKDKTRRRRDIVAAPYGTGGSRV